MIKTIKKDKSLLLSLLIVIAMWFCASAVYAEAGTTQVYLTISIDGEFVTGQNGTVMAHVPMSVSYFDLKDYGLDKYYRYQAESYSNGGQYIAGSAVVEQPTLLHCYIKALETYYAGRELTASDMHSSIINITGAPTQLFMTSFWGHNQDLMYFVNHKYPLMSQGWGATCDYILLNDGDEIDVALFSDPAFRYNGSFYNFNKTSATILEGESITLILSGVPTNESMNGQIVADSAMSDEVIRISSDYGKTWVNTDKTTNNSGVVTLSFDKPGKYFISAGPKYATYQYVAPPICIVTVNEDSSHNPDPTPDPDPDPTPTPDPDPTPDPGPSGPSGPSEPTEDLSAIKTQAKADLAAYKSSKDLKLYRDAQKAELGSAVEQGNKAIDTAADSATVASALADAKAAIDAVKTDAELAAEEAAQAESEKLVKAVSEACLEISGYKDPMLYREDEKAELLAIIAEEEQKIKQAKTTDEVEVLMAAAKARLDGVKTDAEMTREEQAAEKHQEAMRAASVKAARAAKVKASARALKKSRAKISWKKVTIRYSADDESASMLVSGYQVYRSTKKSSGYKKVKQLSGSKTSFTDKKLKKGKIYYYKVRTVTNIDGKTYTGKWSSVSKVKGK